VRLLSYEAGGAGPQAGILLGEDLVPTAALGAPATVRGLLTALDARALIDLAARAQSAGERIALSDVSLCAPVPDPEKIICLGLNYRDHARESGQEIPTSPIWFAKFANSLLAAGQEILLPADAPAAVDYEAELAVVIGKAGYQIPASQAMEHVFGYTVMNDVSARDVQRATTQWSLGKSFPTFAPMGPWVVSKDEVPDPHALGISMTIGGERLQDSNTGKMIFRIPALIEYIAGIVPLEVGDTISTGTPAGVGMGRTPQRWLKPGEEMVVRVEGIGELRNPVVAE
jgi:2-keto-4-pentenoate hydratase/2-oxohepta-3-ene-1,7-dioic acid hydratase in catechol pathway